ncbi:MAG: DNA-binding protein WhiA [Clostridiales bacterium]|nr:DNA-binding protein WhiA [Clostridiales bacterium]
MTFSAMVKNEMCRASVKLNCCAAAELYGVFLFSNTFNENEIRIITEHEIFSTRIQAMLKRVFQAEFDNTTVGSSVVKDVLVLTDKDALDRIMEYYGYDESRHFALHLNAALLEEEHCREAFIRGAFLAAGSVTSPDRGYHLELVTRHYHLSREVMALLLDMGFSPKITMRKSNYMIYFKDSEAVEDFLTKSGAPSSAIKVMEAKVEKELRNHINRRVNCEPANLSKTVDAAQRQIESIRKLKESGRFENLPDKLRQSAELRLKYPDATLGELVTLSPLKVSRSGLNHRLNRLVELAETEHEDGFDKRGSLYD